ncbi:hypothetical protein phytr_2370 [Candidatus Phycorickettsia trachydisci]|uniref:Uncharacterized protein n=1 Tax=Candidatus Phycorickettsia trachydisci TaxID=2115978 RepID=A0A2P1P7E5_9RICK|nr:hypothetical protein [Candidatus Phycorickettsia trachydisci]AVP87194.1 hypothetical protein phytr_2370 [Candidatus Phycorickettsia trachydisci]
MATISRYRTSSHGNKHFNALLEFDSIQRAAEESRGLEKSYSAVTPELARQTQSIAEEAKNPKTTKVLNYRRSFSNNDRGL